MLAKKLSELLGEHIKKLLPDIEKLIKRNFDEYTSILDSLGPTVVCENEYDAFEYLSKVIEEYCSAYQNLILGNANFSSDN